MEESTLTKQQKIVVLKNGIEFYIDNERLAKLLFSMKNLGFDDDITYCEMHPGCTPDCPTAINFTKRMYDGAFLPKNIEERNLRKNGSWQCSGRNWHTRDERQCDCTTEQQKKFKEAIQEATKFCTKSDCEKGWIRTDNGMAEHACVLSVKRKYGKI